jgi:hypothetical protein
MTENILGQSAPTSLPNSTDANISPVANQTAPAFDYNSFFPEDIRKDPEFDKYSKNFPKDLQGIAKDYYHKNKHFGKARDVVKAELEAELNKPAEYKPEDYSYELPEGYEIENEILDVAKNKARELGIKPEIAKQFIKEIFTADAKIANKLDEEMQVQEKAKYETEKAITEGLKKEWGFEYENNVKLADTTLAKLTTLEDYNKIVSLPKDIQATIAKVFHKIGTRMSEGAIGGTGQPTMSAQSKINSIMADPNHAYHRGDHKAVNEVMALYTEIAKGKIGG